MGVKNTLGTGEGRDCEMRTWDKAWKIIVLYDNMIIKTIVHSKIIVSSFTHLFRFLIYTFVKIFPYNKIWKRPGAVKGPKKLQIIIIIIIWKLFPQLICFLVLGSCWYLTKLIPSLILGKSWPYCNNLFPHFNWLKQIIHPKMKMCWKCTHPHGIPVENKNRKEKKKRICWLGMFWRMEAGLSWFKLVLSWLYAGYELV